MVLRKRIMALVVSEREHISNLIWSKVVFVSFDKY
jgi:hypothetical protein